MLTPEWMAQRLAPRRDSINPFPSLNAATTALLAIDLQAGFVDSGSSFEVPGAQAAAEASNRIAQALRARGGQIVYLQHTVDDEALATWPVFFEYFTSASRRRQFIETFSIDAQGHRPWSGLDIAPATDWMVPKRRFSAFVPGSSDLHARLQARGIDTLIITGVVTNVCCESTARDAMMMNYKVVMASDGNAAHSRAEHEASLANLMFMFADVRSTESVVAALK